MDKQLRIIAPADSAFVDLAERSQKANTLPSCETCRMQCRPQSNTQAAECELIGRLPQDFKGCFHWRKK